MDHNLLNKEALAALKELVYQFENTYWSSWQSTAHFVGPIQKATEVLVKAGMYE